MTSNKLSPPDLWETLSPGLSQERKERIISVAKARTEHVTLVLQDVTSEHNICACLRSAEAFGIQNVHIINETKNYKISTVAKGSSSWLTIYNHKSIKEAATYLKEQNYILLAAVPKQNSVTLDEISVKKPLALVFGNEHSGISPEWDKYIDQYFTIPMFGFVESLNISVSAAISMQHVAYKARNTIPEESYLLSKEKRATLLNNWSLKKIPHALKKYEHIKGSI